MVSGITDFKRFKDNLDLRNPTDGNFLIPSKEQQLRCLIMFKKISLQQELLTYSLFRIHLTIAPRASVGYEMIDSEEARRAELATYHLLSNKHEWNNCFIKTIDKYCQILLIAVCKTI